VENIEELLISENAAKMRFGKISEEKSKLFIKALMTVLSSEKKEGERVSDFESRIRDDFKRALKESYGQDER